VRRDLTSRPIPKPAAPAAAPAAEAAPKAAPAASGPAPAAAEPAAAEPAAAEPVVVVEPGAALSVEAQAAKNSQWPKLKERLEQRGLDDPPMIEACAKYVLAITAPAPDMAAVKLLLKDITDRLQQAKAFERTVGEDDSTDHTDGFNLWSGAKEQAKQYGEDNKGVALESSAAGSLFDGLNFDMKWNAALADQWNELSRLYAQGIRGKVNIHQYRGVRTGSVFNKVEYPTIKDSIAAGLVEPVVHLYANCGPLSGAFMGTPFYGAGEASRKVEKVVQGKSALDAMMASQWEFGDALEKAGGHWPAGKGGEHTETPHVPGAKVRPGEHW
jgi:hypothetical protein